MNREPLSTTSTNLSPDPDADAYKAIATHVPVEFRDYLGTAIRCGKPDLAADMLHDLIRDGKVFPTPELDVLTKKGAKKVRRRTTVLVAPTDLGLDSPAIQKLIAKHVPVKYREYLLTTIRCGNQEQAASILDDLMDSKEIPNLPEFRAAVGSATLQEKVAEGSRREKVKKNVRFDLS